MSRVLFSADYHIKLGQKNVPKDWQKNRFHLLYKELLALEDQVDLHIIGGDIFDRTPSLEELDLFVDYIVAIKIPTIIFSGNHEATKKGKTFFEQLKLLLETLNPLVTVPIGATSILGMDIIPYEDLKSFDPKSFSNDILFTHVRGAIEPHVKPEIDLNQFKRWKRVFAGDLHSHTNSQRNIVYPGSPMTTTFHKTPTKTGVIILDSETAEYDWIPLKLPQLIRKTVDSELAMLVTTFDHTIYELTGSLEELAGAAKSNPLLDKKIVKRKVDAKIDFSKLESLEAELLHYLVEVKGLAETGRITKVYNDNISKDDLE